MQRRRGRGALREWLTSPIAARVTASGRGERARRKRRAVRLGPREMVRAGVAFAVCLLALAVADRTRTEHAPFGTAGLEAQPQLRACAAAHWFDKLPGAVRDPNSRCASAAEVGFAVTGESSTPTRLRAQITAGLLAPRVAPRDVVLELVREDDRDGRCSLEAAAAGECGVERGSLAF